MGDGNVLLPLKPFKTRVRWALILNGTKTYLKRGKYILSLREWIIIRAFWSEAHNDSLCGAAALLLGILLSRFFTSSARSSGGCGNKHPLQELATSHGHGRRKLMTCTCSGVEIKTFPLIDWFAIKLILRFLINNTTLPMAPLSLAWQNCISNFSKVKILWQKHPSSTVYGNLTCKSSHKVRSYSIELPHVRLYAHVCASVAPSFARTHTYDRALSLFQK